MTADGKAVPDVLIMDSPSGCQMALAYLALPNYHLRLCGGALLAKVDGQSSHPFVGVLEFI
jgi:hypothetical protein